MSYSICCFWCPRVVEQELLENCFPIAYPDGMVSSGWWFWSPRVAEQKLLENRFPIVYPDGMVGSGWWFWCPRVAEQELLENLPAIGVQHGMLRFAGGFGAPEWLSRSCLKIVRPSVSSTVCCDLLLVLEPQSGSAGAA